MTRFSAGALRQMFSGLRDRAYGILLYASTKARFVTDR
jgi:hypothetical protein